MTNELVPPGGDRPWEADVELDLVGARALLQRHLTNHDVGHIQPLGAGWDNAAFVVDLTAHEGAPNVAPERWVFRFPRRALGAELIVVENALLPAIAHLLPLAVPVPELIGAPDEDFPYPFGGYRLLPGQTACGRVWSPEERQALGAAVARFLRCLHAADDELTARAPGDRIFRADMKRRVGNVLRKLELAEKLALDRGQNAGDRPRLPNVDLAQVREEVVELAATPPHQGAPVLSHGDLYARHLLVDDEGQPTGVIDWGDLHRGDPAIDLSFAFSFVPDTGRDRFFEAYGEVDPDTKRRARFRALHYGVLLWHYGLEVDDADLERVGLTALELSMPTTS